MENISKGLIMAAGVLLGVMILVFAVYIFQLYVSYTSESYKILEESQISQFNTQFLKYYGNITNEEGQQEPIKCTAHDIVTVSNLANENNIQYELTQYDENTYYIQVDLGNNRAGKNLENWNSDQKIQFIKENATNGDKIKYYKCTQVKISDKTSRVCYIKFEEI
ncbi:MAG: hypothetical protein ACI4UU_02375 [Clostridia bacterium]